MTKPEAILSHMRASGGRLVPDAELHALLWPEGMPASGDAGASVFLHRARKRLGPDETIRKVRGQGYRYVADAQP